MVIAKGSRDVPLAISAKVPMSSSATKASPIPPPTIAPVLGPTIFSPIFIKLKYLSPCLASTALLAIFFARLLPALIPKAPPPIATGPICANA